MCRRLSRGLHSPEEKHGLCGLRLQVDTSLILLAVGIAAGSRCLDPRVYCEPGPIVGIGLLCFAGAVCCHASSC